MRYEPEFKEIVVDDEALVIHGHGQQRRDALIIFLHGLGGTRYGTWTGKKCKPAEKSFPKFLYEDCDQLDIGLYSYRSLLRRLVFWKSIELETEAEVLASTIRNLVEVRGYRSIILAGHSMGGILARATLADLINTGRDDVLPAIKGMFLLATPQAGSLRVPRLLAGLTSDSRALKAHGEVVTRIHNTLVNNIVSHRELVRPGRFFVPSFVVSAAEDNWVDPFSAGFSATAENINRVRGSHVSAVKPTHKDDEAYAWVLNKLRGLLAASPPPPPPLPPVNPFEDCDLNGKILINRVGLRGGIRAVVDRAGATRIFAVKGKPRSGKSHSVYFIEHVEQAGQFRKAVIDLSERGAPATYTPRDLAAELLQLLQCDATRIPAKTRGQTKSRWVQGIAAQIVGHLKDKDGISLIVLDGFAHPSLPAETRELVRELVRHADRERSVRVALLDYSDDLLVAQAKGRLMTETVSEIGDDDLKRFFLSIARSTNVDPPQPDALDRLVQEVRSAATAARVGAAAAGDESDNERIGQAAEMLANALRAVGGAAASGPGARG